MSWYASWFDSEYYHLLYQNRNDNEAEVFLNNLKLALPDFEGKSALDLCCGKGRHARWMHKNGLKTTGYDLSKNSISEAKKLGPLDIRYKVMDMRDPLGSESFDFVFNLFTSFGYFEEVDDNYRVIAQVYEALKPGGYFIQDYLNPKGVLSSLIAKEAIQRGSITFHIDRFVDEENFLCKYISWEDQNQQFEFTERVFLFSPNQMDEMMSGIFEKVELFGDYHLGPMDEPVSPRQITIWKKIG